MKPYYSEDGVTIYHAQCEDVLPAIDPAVVALVLTDPPYGINLRTNYGDKGMSHRAASKNHAQIEGDGAPFDPAPLLRFGRAVLFGANHYANQLPCSAGWIVWDKTGAGRHVSDLSDAELAWTNVAGGVRLYSHMWKGLVRDSEIGYHVHPTQKPVSLMRWLVERHTEPGDLVLDPYMGSGPVARACADLGRRYIGIEVVEDYCRIALDRLRQGALDFGETAHV